MTLKRKPSRILLRLWLEWPAPAIRGRNQRPCCKNCYMPSRRSGANLWQVLRAFQAAVYVTSKTAPNTIAVFFAAVFLLQLSTAMIAAAEVAHNDLFVVRHFDK